MAFYLGLAGLSIAWLGLGRRLASARPPSLRQLWAVAALWSAPLVAGPVLFSHDVYSYLAQGEILHLGMNPYREPPLLLGVLGHPHLLAAVSPFWRDTTAPYGPLFMTAAGAIVASTGSHLIAGVLALRALDLGGMILVAWFVPRLARALGADPLRATWLTVASPLVLLELVAAAHNEALMVGLMVAGVTLAVTGRPLPAIALCALAATVKLPGAVALAFVAASWAWSCRDRLRALAASVLTASVVVLAVSALAGVGLSWASGSLFSTPQKVHLAITPATGLGWTLAAGLRALGLAVSAGALESAVAAIALVALVSLTAVSLWRTRPETMVRDLGLVLVAAALCGPAAWPWYLTWGTVLLAAVPSLQRSPALPAAALASVFVVKADGILALHLSSAPAVVAVYAVLATVAWRARVRRGGRSGRAARHPAAAARVPAASDAAPSALVQSR